MIATHPSYPAHHLQVPPSPNTTYKCLLPFFPHLLSPSFPIHTPPRPFSLHTIFKSLLHTHTHTPPNPFFPGTIFKSLLPIHCIQVPPPPQTQTSKSLLSHTPFPSPIFPPTTTNTEFTHRWDYFFPPASVRKFSCFPRPHRHEPYTQSCRPTLTP